MHLQYFVGDRRTHEPVAAFETYREAEQFINRKRGTHDTLCLVFPPPHVLDTLSAGLRSKAPDSLKGIEVGLYKTLQFLQNMAYMPRMTDEAFRELFKEVFPKEV